ncbi:MAG: uridine diphosphate-N-acetylglucosamine-binding protein YvcK [Anaerolineae bacterium]|jgi:uncharacterized cofD-like protein|nr:uridine diphosphate-N-acetylglucosamine-binding protein YvcK [Anaerolineae bacterium]
MSTRWFLPGLGVKRWLLVLLIGIVSMASGLAYLIVKLVGVEFADLPLIYPSMAIVGGMALLPIALYRIFRNLFAPYRRFQRGSVADVVYSHSRKNKGMKVVAIGGGTGLPSVLRAMKPYTGNITAIVTMADDGGSSGRLRRDLGVLPPGDLRNNIAALADDESLMTQLFQYRFSQGELEGHAFGNLFIAALSGISGNLESALIEIARVLNLQGRVFPSTMQDVKLTATIQYLGKNRVVKVIGESQIGASGGQIEAVSITPEDAEAFEPSVQAILEAEVIIMGPGSLYTSILPNLMVRGIAEALRATHAYKVYICNVATQPGETEGYTVADHVIALERHIGRGVFQTVLANNVYPKENAGENTHYVQAVSPKHEIAQRYEVIYTDLVDQDRPWRHDPNKLAQIILQLRGKIIEKVESA